jgi:hypothetical protein
MIEILVGFPENVLAVRCLGMVTKADYETVLIPAIERALGMGAKLGLYLEVEADFSGMEAAAMWEDLKVGAEHRRDWERVAVVTDVHWIELATQLYRLLLPCPVRAFPTARAAEARDWLTAPG